MSLGSSTDSLSHQDCPALAAPVVVDREGRIDGIYLVLPERREEHTGCEHDVIGKLVLDSGLDAYHGKCGGRRRGEPLHGDRRRHSDIIRSWSVE